MNIYRINLNLLKVFAVLMRERHVSTAAKCLHLTQPAISNSLQQLRELFQDELLIRGTKTMTPTQKALYLAPKIEQVLSQLETSLFYTDEFQYKSATRTFNLGMTDYAEYMLLPKLYKQLTKLAPGISLRVFNHNTFSAENFENEPLELGIGLEKKFPKQLISERLYADRSVCVARVNHPIFKKPLSIERYLQNKHLAACVYSEELSRPDRVLKKLGRERQIKLTLPNVLPAFQILATSDLIGTFSQNIVSPFEKKYRLQQAPLPFAIPEFYIAQVWHRQQDNDSGLIWLRGLVKDICARYFL